MFVERYNFARERIIIDALRGMAALLVFISHADAYYLVRLDLFNAMRSVTGGIGVQIFFILSGLLIWSSAERLLLKSGGLYEYAIHRATRIMPLYYVALVFAIFAFPKLSSFPADINLYNVARHITFTQALNPPVTRAFNPLLWTLTHEFIFYLIVPLLFLVRRYFSMIIVSFIGLKFLGEYYTDFLLSPLFRVVYLFGIGMTIAQYKLVPTKLAALFLIGLASAMARDGIYSVSTISQLSGEVATVSIAVAIFVFAMAWRECRVFTPVVLLASVGTISYSLYIWHYMLIEIAGLRVTAYSQQYAGLSALLFTAFCLAFCWISYYFIERPGQTKLRDWLLEGPREMKPGPI